MKEKKRIVILASVLVLITFTVTSYIYALNYAGGGAQNITSTVNTSRYIMFGGAYNVDGSDRTDNAVFKLDTYTGDTWILNVKSGANGDLSKIWTPVGSKVKKIVPKNSESQRLQELYPQ